MTVTDALALYGAVVSTGLAAWQVVLSTRSRQTRVSVTGESIPAFVGDGRIIRQVRMTVLNLSEHPVRVVAAAIRFADATEEEILMHGWVSQSEDQIPPRDSQDILFPWSFAHS